MFPILSCVHSLFWSFGTKWREERVDMCSCCFESTKYTRLMCINHFCLRCSVFESDKSVAGWKAGSPVAYCESCFWEKMTKWILKKPTTGTNWTGRDSSQWNCDVPLGISSSRRQTKFKNRLRLSKANCIWSRLLRLVLPSLIALARKASSSFPQFRLSHTVCAILVSNNRRLH